MKSLTPEVAGATVGGTTAALTGKDWLAGAQYGMMVYGTFAAVYRAQSVKPCFPAETQVETATGFQRIDELREGDWVWSRNEFDPHGPLDHKRVEEVFIRPGRIWHLHVGTRVIRVTPEHPVYVQNKGWTAVGDLQAGDILRTETGWLPVEDLLDTGEDETVYNLRVAEWHTYFVGDRSWGFSVWAHNACTPKQIQDAAGNWNGNPKLTYNQARYVSGLFNQGKVGQAQAYLSIIPGFGPATISKLTKAFGGITVSTKNMKGWTTAQQAEADAKIAFLNTQTPVSKTPAVRSSTSAAERYRRAGKTIPKNTDIDHLRDLQFGGPDTVANMAPLNKSVNRSLGSQFGHTLDPHPNGTVISHFEIK